MAYTVVDTCHGLEQAAPNWCFLLQIEIQQAKDKQMVWSV
jgi:hypothetical protein